MKKIKILQFRDEPLADLIWELESEASKWCEKNCPYAGGLLIRLIPYSSLGRLPCFDDERGAFHLDEIEKCKKIPKLYKLYWKAKSENISAIAPLVVYKEAK